MTLSLQLEHMHTRTRRRPHTRFTCRGQIGRCPSGPAAPPPLRPSVPPARPGFLDCICLAPWASGLCFRYSMLQNLFSPFPRRNPRKGRDQILPTGNLGTDGGSSIQLSPNLGLREQESSFLPSLSGERRRRASLTALLCTALLL